MYVIPGLFIGRGPNDRYLSVEEGVSLERGPEDPCFQVVVKSLAGSVFAAWSEGGRTPTATPKNRVGLGGTPIEFKC
jgi:hypothetical protein